MMGETEFQRRFEKMLQEEYKRRSEIILAGLSKTDDDGYKVKIAFLQGLRAALEMCQEVAKSMYGGNP